MKYRCSTAILFLMFWILPSVYSVVVGQDQYLKHYSTESGLPSSTVYSCFQDSKGFIWITTDVGVCRFDGRDFELFTTADGLPGNEVFGIFEDSRNRLWFRTLNGQLGYYLDGRFYDQSKLPISEYKSSGYISMITEDWDNNLYFTTSAGNVVKLNPDFEVGTFHTVDMLLGVLTWNEERKMYLVGASGIYEFSPALQPGKRLVNLKDRLFHKRAFKDGEYIYFSNGGNFERYNVFTDSNQFLFTLPTHIISFIKAGPKAYLGTRDGLYQTSFNGKLDVKEFNAEHCGSKEISSIMIDREGNTWISTLHDGLYLASGRGVFHVPGINTPVFSLYNEDDRILHAGSVKGTYYEIDSLNRKRKSTVTTFNGAGEIKDFKRINGDMWILGKHTFIRSDSRKNETFSVQGGNGLTVTDRGDYLWATHKSVLLFPNAAVNDYMIRRNQLQDPSANRKLTNKMNADKRIKRVLKKRVYASLSDIETGITWFATERGLYSWSDTNDVAQPFSPLSSVSVRDIVKHEHWNRYVLATDEKGLLFVDGKRVTEEITVSDGLPSNSVKCIHVDDDTLWVGTIKGLCKIYLDANQMVVTPLHFVGSRGINDVAVFRSKIYVATDNGIAYFDRNIRSGKSDPMVFITTISSNGNRITGDGFELEYAENNIYIGFTGLSYQNFGKVTYQYMLEGYDLSWNKTASTSLEYKALPPGKYLFKVRTVDPFGNVSDKIAQIRFSVLKPFWLELWFWLVTVFLLLAIVIGVVRVRLKIHKQQLALLEKEKQQIEIERNLIELEQQALRMQMNPHFIFNALNTIKGFYANQNSTEAKNYITVFSKLMRAILDTTSDVITVRDEVYILELYLSLNMIRYQDKFSYEIEVDPSLDVDNTYLPPMLSQPLVENAVIHGLVSMKRKGVVKIAFTNMGDQLKITIEDNGIGRKNAAEANKYKNYSSKATVIIENRLTYLSKKVGRKYELRIEDVTPEKKETGTRVEIILPLIDSYADRNH